MKNRISLLLFVLALVGVSPNSALANSLQLQQVAQLRGESAVHENARSAGVPDATLQRYLRTAKALDNEGIDSAPYLSKLSEGLAKRVNEARLQSAMADQASRMRAAHRLLTANGQADSQSVAAATHLLTAGSSENDVSTLARAARNHPEKTRVFTSMAYGAAQIHASGAGWQESTEFEAQLGRSSLSSEDLDDVNEAVAAGLRDHLVSGTELAALARNELQSPREARRFVQEMFGRARQPNERANASAGNQKNENARSDRKNGNTKNESKSKAGKNDHSGSNDQNNADRKESGGGNKSKNTKP